jgi:Lon protease-like protein
MTQAGNVTYNGPEDVPATVPVFPLAGVLLLPRGHLPLNIFEPRYLDMITEAMRGARLVGMLQPKFTSKAAETAGQGDLSDVGCIGRITQYVETGDGRIIVTLMGVSRFRLVAEIPTKLAFRTCRIDVEPFLGDFTVGVGNDEVDRKTLLETFKAYLEARNLEADWDSIERASNESLVNTLSMMSPYGPAEKQALLEARTLRERAEMLVAVTELALANEAGGDAGSTLQ